MGKDILNRNLDFNHQNHHHPPPHLQTSPMAASYVFWAPFSPCSYHQSTPNCYLNAPVMSSRGHTHSDHSFPFPCHQRHHPPSHPYCFSPSTTTHQSCKHHQCWAPSPLAPCSCASHADSGWQLFPPYLPYIGPSPNPSVSDRRSWNFGLAPMLAPLGCDCGGGAGRWCSARGMEVRPPSPIGFSVDGRTELVSAIFAAILNGTDNSEMTVKRRSIGIGMGADGLGRREFRMLERWCPSKRLFACHKKRI